MDDHILIIHEDPRSYFSAFKSQEPVSLVRKDVLNVISDGMYLAL
jgi:hypothetical protein